MPFVKSSSKGKIVTRYGFDFDSSTFSDLDIEFWFIRNPSKWAGDKDHTLLDHYYALHHILWPEDDQHRWFKLTLKSFVENEISVIMGSADSAKTYGMSCFSLMDYWAFPDETLWLISSTEYRGCELRIWGEIKNLFNRAKEKFPILPGQPMESLHCITTDRIDDEGNFARSFKKGMILVPCKRGSQYVGLSAFQGTKSPRLRHAGDEIAAMDGNFLNAYSNWYGKRDFKGLMVGNPTDTEDQLCRAAEPVDGWQSFADSGKTQEWKSKFFNAHVIALDGRDSPNNDFPSDPLKYHYLISNKKLDAVAKTFGKDSWQWYSQCIGKPNQSITFNRVITRRLCEQHKALESAVWQGLDKHTWIYGLDPAYGGGDRCVGGAIEFGLDLNGRVIVKIHPPEIIPISVRMNIEPEDQIANHIKMRLDDYGIPVENCFYDSFGKGTLGNAFAKIFGKSCPVPVDSGAKPSNRPVRSDLFIQEPNGGRRLVRADEYYSKRVSEMWYSTREIIEAEQMRELPKEVMEEGCIRTYKIVAGNRVEVEPKEDLIERLGRSPDLYDWLAISCEGARQRGFQIKRPLPETEVKKNEKDWLDKEIKEYSEMQKNRQLTTA